MASQDPTRSRPPSAPPPVAAPRNLASPVTDLWGVGPERQRQLERLGIRTVAELLYHRPHRYEDRRKVARIRDLELGVPMTVHGHIVAAGVKTFRKGTKSVYEFVLEDDSGRLHCRWWNLPFLERIFAVGDGVTVYGKPNGLKPRTMDHPETEKAEPGEDPSAHMGRIVPVYPLTEGLPQRVLRGLLYRTVQEFSPQVSEPHSGLVSIQPAQAEDPLATMQPPATRVWPTVAAAVQALHFPEHPESAELARQRLALDEFIELQLTIQRRRQNLERSVTARPSGGTNVRMKPFLASLGFPLTGAQQRVLREIRADLSASVPMRRLLQGDVGSGKTLVAACAALMTLESGWNVAVLAPTEILAGQLRRNFERWFSPLGFAVHLRTGSTRLQHERAAGAILDAPQMWVGTHALLEDGVVMDRLGLVIIDEQHKFGVTQRETLVRKGRTGVHSPHLLVMTATPIPRTLGLTLYGDLDVSVLDEIPAGRGRVRTHVRERGALPKVWQFITQQLAAGRQAYVVYPRVNESEQDEAKEIKAVTKEFARVQTALKPHAVGLLHGQLPAEEKESVMQAFRTGAIKVLLATTVIEIGVDVANATVMLIENAEQFGLVQLHQLRGRIGRGAHESHCILVAESRTEAAVARLKVMEETADGFALAEADFRLRGPGELVGHAQSGAAGFRFGNLHSDRNLVEVARDLAKRHLRREVKASPSR